MSKPNLLMNKLNLHESIMNTYIEEAPPTFYLGSKTIDGIYTSMDMSILQGGYIDEKYCPGDHHWLWIDIELSQVLGNSKQKEEQKVPRKVNSKIPSIRKCFNNKFNSQVKKHLLGIKVNLLKEKCKKR